MSFHVVVLVVGAFLILTMASGCAMSSSSGPATTQKAVAAPAAAAAQAVGAASAVLGPFTNRTDVGVALPSAGKSEFSAPTNTLTISAGGANVWAAQDDFHFVWKRVSGDMTLATDVAFAAATPGAVDHRKAVLMIRQSLDPDAAYADACIHGNGMSALQWREAKGDRSYQLQVHANLPKRVRIEKRGDYFTMSMGTTDADLKPAGGAVRMSITGEYYIGVGVCSHSTTRLETVAFSNITLAPTQTTGTNMMVNTLEVYQLSNRDRKVQYVLAQPNNRRFEAPNWHADGTLYFNNGGRLYKLKAMLPSSNPPTNVNPAPQPELVDQGPLTNLNNDHVISFDGKMFAVSDQSAASNRQSTIWTIPVAGGTPKKITTNVPSYMHGWSPDGKTLVFAGRRTIDGVVNWDIYGISSEGGEEKRLTTTAGREDGPEYSPDGRYIYFNSDRTGKMQIWRMRPDGSNQEQVIRDETSNDWFPHISPNGQWMVYISFDLTVASGDHPESKHVMLKLKNMQTNESRIVGKFFGGQGTINVPSWSPDSTMFAFVSYQIIPQ